MLGSRHDRSELVAELDPEERRLVAEELWESLNEEDASHEFSEAQIKGIERRAAEFEADPSIGIPWEIVGVRLLAKFG